VKAHENRGPPLAN